MQIAVISDLHLGKKDKLDQFHRNLGAETQLYKLLTYLENNVDKIILLGDIFETLRSKSPTKREEELRNILKAYPKIAEKIKNNKKYILIQGNHDEASGKVLGAPSVLKLKDGDSHIAFFHGHQVDHLVYDFVEKNFWKFGTWAGGWLERLGFDITRKMNKNSKFKALNDLWKVGKFEKSAVEFGKKLKADIVVTGHSHHPMKEEIGSNLFLNSGTRVAGRQDMIIIDTSRHQYDVYKKFSPSSQAE